MQRSCHAGNVSGIIFDNCNHFTQIP
jgi:hypothetical protein